jgi:hypothetical protein
VDLDLESRCSRHSFGELADHLIHAHAHVQEFLLFGPRLPVLGGEHACFTEIIHRQKLPQRGAGAPAGHTLCVGLDRFVEMADQGQQHMAVFVVLFSW